VELFSETSTSATRHDPPTLYRLPPALKHWDFAQSLLRSPRRQTL
jgi:hypothetical protein